MRIKLTKRKVLMISIALLLLIAGGFLFLHSPFIKSKVLRYAIGYVEKKQAAILVVGSLDYNLLKLQFTLKDVVVRDSRKTDFPPFFQADEIEIRIPLSLLLRKRLQIHRLEIQNPVVNIHVDQEGKSNIPFPSKSEKKRVGQVKFPEVIFHQLWIRNARILLKDQGKLIEGVLPRMDLSLRWIGEGVHSLRLDMHERGWASYRERIYPLDALGIDAEIGYRGLDFKRFSLDIAETRLEFNGRVNDFSSPSIDGHLQGEIEIDDVRSLLSMERDLSGKIRIHSHIKGPLDALDAHMTLRCDSLRFQELQDIQLETDVRWMEKHLVIPSLRLGIAGGEIRAKGEFYPLDADAGNQLDLEWNTIDLEHLDLLFHQNTPIGSVTSGTAKMSWTGFSLNSTRGQAEIRLSGKGKKIESLSLPLSGRILATADSGKVTLSTKNLTIPGALLMGKFLVGPQLLSGRFQLEAQDLKHLLSFLSETSNIVDRKTIERLNLNGQVRVLGKLEGTLKSPHIQAKLMSTTISIQNLRDLNLEGVIVFEPGRLRLDPIRIHEGRGELELTGHYSWEPSRQFMRFDVSGERISLQKILEAFYPTVQAKGQINLKASIEGKPEDPTIESSLSLKEATFSNQDFDKVEMTWRFQEKKLILDSFKAEKAEGTVEAKGWFNLQEKNYSTCIFIDSLDIQDFSFPSSSRKVNAKVNLRLDAEGSIGFPQIVARGSLGNVTLGRKELGDLLIEANSLGEYLKFRIMAPIYSSSLEGNLHLKSPYVLNAVFDAHQLSLMTMKDRLQLLQEQDVTGHLTSEVKIQMALRNPRETMNLKARVEEFQFKTGHYQLKSEAPIVFSYDSQGFKIDRLQIAGPDIKLQVEGFLPIKSPSLSGMNLKADIDLSFISRFLRNMDAQGLLRLESHTTGTISDLEISADLALSGARFAFTQLPVSFEDIQLDVNVSKNMLNVESFSFRLEDGIYELEGNIPFESLPLKFPAEWHVYGKRSARILLRVRNFDPSIMKDVLSLDIFEQISGDIDGKIQVEGERLRLSELSAKATFDTLDLDLFGIPLAQENPSLILLDQGKVTLQSLSLSGQENRLIFKGTVDLTEAKALDVSMDGLLELRMLRAFMEEPLFSGKTKFQVQVTETLHNPKMRGFLEIQEGGLQVPYPRLFLDQIRGRIEIDSNRLQVGRISGNLNGGNLEISGNIHFHQWMLQEAGIFLKCENSLFDFPENLHSQISSKLRFESDGKNYFLGGSLTVIQAKYTEAFSVESAVYRYLRRGAAMEGFREQPAILANLYFDVNITTANSFLIDNNLSKSESKADLKLTGTLYNPVLAGRVDVVEGGEIYFSQNTFHIERGTIDFVNPNRIEPDFNLAARTRVGEYDIQLLLTGTPEKFSADFTSEPLLSEPNIISLLVTGRTLESASASVLNVAGNKALSYINSAVTGRIEQAAARSLGLESVRIDASLVSTEENPGARITVGQHIGQDFELVFSQDLKDAQNRTWIANYNPHSNINLQGVKRDKDEYNLALRHELLFGLAERPEQISLRELAGKGIPVNKIWIEGRLGLTEKMVRKQIKLVEGKRFDFHKLRESLERIRNLYRRNNFLSYTLNVRKEEEEDRMSLIFHIESGPKIWLNYQGAKIPKKLQKEFIHTWMGSSFGQLVLEDISRKLRLHLMEKGYYQAAIHTSVQSSREDEKVIVFKIIRGVKYKKPHIIFNGNRFISSHSLLAFLRRSKLINHIFVYPLKVTRNLEDFYAQKGFLQTEVNMPEIHFQPKERQIRVSFSIAEAPLFTVGRVQVIGARFLSEEQIVSQINIHTGEILSLRKTNEANLKIRELYTQRGFNDVRVQSQRQIHEEKGLVDLIFHIEENQQGKIAEIEISGNTITHMSVIHRELRFKKGDIVDYQLINETRKRLYDLGIFERVNIGVVPVSDEEIATSPDEGSPSNSVRFFRVEIGVAELRPYRLRYGLQYDTESSFGTSAELIHRNFLGNAQLLGAHLRLNRDERDIRGFFRSPYFLSKKINTEFFTFFNRKKRPLFTVDRYGFTFQQQTELSRSYFLTYNYTFEHHRTFDHKLLGEPAEIRMNVGTLNFAITRDTRDNILNASRGMFLSQSIGYAPEILGSDIRFIRYFGQFYAFTKLTDGLVYASGIRVGLSKAWDEGLVPSERFFAGGGTTIRGFGRDEIGPKDPYTGLPQGGEAVFILNQELRFPIYRKLSGVVFADFGNIYAKTSGFDPFDVRKTAGFGLRFQTPFALLRFDWGFKLDRRPGEPLSKIFFSIGQAF